MGPVFLLWPSKRDRISRLAVAIITTLVMAAAVAAWAAAFGREFRTAYTWAGPSIFSDLDRQQMDEVRAAVPEGAAILLCARAADVWHARLWQRGMYPSHPTAVLLEPISPTLVRTLRHRFDIRHAVLIGPPSTNLVLRESRDLGALPGSSDRVLFGNLEP